MRIRIRAQSHDSLWSSVKKISDKIHHNFSIEVYSDRECVLNGAFDDKEYNFITNLKDLKAKKLKDL